MSGKLKYHDEIVVSSSTGNLATIRTAVRKIAEKAGFAQDVIGKIILAVDEACTNVIKHAYNYSPDGEIDIQMDLVDSKLVIKIVDDGTNFNPNHIPDPDLKEYHKQKRVGGLGMFLMKKLMDEVLYDNPGNKNRVTLIKYLD